MGRVASGLLALLAFSCWCQQTCVVAFVLPEKGARHRHGALAAGTATLSSFRFLPRGGRGSQQRGHGDPSTTRATTICRTSTCHLSEAHQEKEQLEQEERHAGSPDVDLWEALTGSFQGDFDNYQQVVDDRSNNLVPREGGGHEHIHCTLIPVAHDARLAAFYFDGQPDAIFRFRYYHLIPRTRKSLGGSDTETESSNTEGDEVVAVDTILYTLHPDLEKQLRASSLDPLAWPDIFHNFSAQQQQSSKDDSSSSIKLLPKCDVRWSFEMDPVLHAYAADYHSTHEQQHPLVPSDTRRHESDQGIHAVMVHGQAIVDSQMIPGQKILIQDQLSLWHDELWIHDRGYNPDTMQFIYGNQRGIPYRLERVASCRTKTATTTTTLDKDDDDDAEQPPLELLDRVVCTPDLSWTLGAPYRTPQDYEEKIAAVGGPSGPPRRKPKAE